MVAIYQFFSPWRYRVIIVGFLPVAWTAWRTRSILVSIVTHMAINMVTMLAILAST
jgi:hypothetical protein